jgi:hypothetical protein
MSRRFDIKYAPSYHATRGFRTPEFVSQSTPVHGARVTLPTRRISVLGIDLGEETPTWVCEPVEPREKDSGA